VLESGKFQEAELFIKKESMFRCCITTLKLLRKEVGRPAQLENSALSSGTSSHPQSLHSYPLPKRECSDRAGLRPLFCK